MRRRLLAAFLALVMLLGLLPLGTLAEETGEKTKVGSVKVIVENTTASPAPGGGYGTWETGATQWSGERVNTTVDLYADSTAMTCIAKALEGHNVTGIDSNYISAIDGLVADSSITSGWMGTLNDWFTANTFDQYTYANGTLRDGDEIRLMYTLNYGPDVGSVYNSDKKLSALAVTGGTLNPAFAGTKTDYELVIGEEDSAEISITPTATNKNFLAVIFQGEMTVDQAKALAENSWYTGDTIVGRGKTVTASPDDVFTVVVGAPNWPSMSNGYDCKAENVDPCVYTVKVVQQGTDTAAPFNAFFTGLSGIATVENDATYPMTVDDTEKALVSSNAGKSSSFSGITLTFQKAAKLSFSYKASSEEKWDYLKLTKTANSVDTELNSDYTAKSDFSGAMTEYKTCSLEMNAGEKLRIGYYKDSSGNGNSDCVWVKDFVATLPKKVVFHANDGTDTTTQQGIFGTADLTANTFTRDGYRFDGWATTATGEVAYADGASVTLGDQDLDLYAVWTKVWEVTFPNMPAGATITVKQGDAAQEGAEGKWLLADGSYTYSASLFGYEAVTDKTFAVSGADLAISDTLTQSATHTVTFNVTGAAEGTTVTVTLKNSQGTEMTPKSGETFAFEVPAGAYTYTIEAKGYQKIKDKALTVGSEDKTVAETLQVSITWDGTAETPTLSGGVYQISNAQELAGFAQLVNTGSTSISARLTANIVLNDEDEMTHKWTPIGSTSANAFTGSFYGDGHTISGLYMDGTDTCVGLFGYVGQGGLVEKFTLSGASVKSTASGYSSYYAALVAGSNQGTIQAVKLESSAVSGSYVVGGIAGLNKGTVTGCANESATVTQNTAKDQGVGGIVGQNEGTVSLSYNKAHIIRGHSSTNYAYLGGIAGKQTSGATMESCYNRGEVDTAYCVGGLVGSGAGTIQNCYSTGTVPSGKKALVGSGSPTVTNCFYLDTCGATDTKGTSKTAAEFATLAASLGGAFEDGASYPTLKWENPNATFSITLKVSPARAEVALAGEDTPDAQTDTEADTATYVWTGLSKGSYGWSTSCDQGDTDDFITQSGTVTLSAADASLDITLVPKTYDVTFNLTPTNAELTLTQGDTAQTPEAGTQAGTVTYKLPMGTYQYTAKAYGYDDATGTVTVAKTEGLEEQNVALTRQTSYALSFTLPEGASLTVSHETGGIQTPSTTGDTTVTYTLVPGTYSYTVKKQGFATKKGTVTLEAEAKDVTVTLDALTAWDGSTVATGFADGDGTQNSPYEIESGSQLAYLSQQVAAGDTTLTKDTYYILTANIDLNHKSFTPIGTDSSHAFLGHFDGNDHTISNLTISRSASYTGLFGYSKGSVADLTLDGASVTNTTGNTGILAGGLYSGNNATVTGCLVKNSSVTGASNNTGGLIGYSGVAVTGCAVVDTTVSGASYCGGVFGQIGAKATNCYALRVTVTASSTYAGGLIGGGNSSTTVESCFARGTVTGGSNYTGGLIGNGSSSYSKPKISKSYAVVDLSATSGTVGTLAGGSNVAITAASSFYCTGSTLPEDVTTNGTGKTLAELKNSTILTSLGDAFAIYAQDDGLINAGLPYLTAAPAIAKVIPATLTAPTLTWSDMTLSWTAVDNAQGYRLTLTKGEDNSLFSETVTETSHDFATLLNLNGSGTYTATVTALGDGEAYKDSAQATAETTVTITTGDVTFNVTPAGGESFPQGREPKIQVALADGTTLTLENGTAKALPLGTYTYTVSAKTYTTQTATFELTAEGKTFNLALVYSAAWDGETTVEPQQTDGVYQITNGYELAWFRDKVNATLSTGNQSCNLSAKLTQDVSLGGHNWTPISPVTSTSATKGYTGTFNGDGHTISGLKPVGTEVTSYSKTEIQGAGLFGYVYTGGTVENLTVAGSLAAVKYSGGVVAILAGGTVKNCVNAMPITLDAATTDGYSIGGVVGYMTNSTAKSSAVTGCRNQGTVTLGEKGRYVGGVVGNASYGTGITNCANTGAVSGGSYVGGITGSAGVPTTACRNDAAVTGTADYVGGIAGLGNKELASCYNTGTVTGAGTKNGVGGVVGQLNSKYGSITGCLNTGTVTATGDYSGALVGSRSDTSAAITHSYYLTGTATKAIGANAVEADETTGIDSAMLGKKALVGLLGGKFATDADSTAPILAWEKESTQWILTFQVPQGATVTLNGQTNVEGEPGVYALSNGTYSYQVSLEEYATKTGSVTISDASTSLTVELEKLTYDVTFDVKTEGATITVTDGEGATQSPDAENSSLYHLTKGSYSYTVSKFGFESVSGTFDVTGEAVSIPAITLTGSTTYTLTLTFSDENGQSVTPTSVTVTASDGTVVQPNGDSFAYTLPAGTYTCTVADSTYYNVEKSITVTDDSKTVPISLETNRTWDGTTLTEVTPNTDGVYEIGNAAELAWFASKVNEGNTGYNAKLTADIYINYNGSTNTWTSIGSYSKQYTGTFDGNGKSIYGLNKPLFGYNGTGSLVKDVTVYGTISGESNVGGICTASYGAFQGCVNRATIQASGQRVGGIVGLLYAGGSITNCANYGSVSTTYTGSSVYYSTYSLHLGGLVGKASGPVTGSFNAGTVTGGTGYGGVGGIAGEIDGAKITGCYNTASVTGPSRTGGIVGIANSTAATGVENCYNVGTVTTVSTSANPFCGAIAGSIADSNGAQVGTVNNCYYLDSSYTCGVGYPGTGITDPATAKSASEMKLDAFTTGLGSAFNMDSGSINGGYPVLTWQGGTAPEVSQDEQDVAADKAALTLGTATVTTADKLTLPATGENGSTITWASSNTAIIAADGTVTLPTDNEVTVTLTATLTKGSISDTKEFSLVVKTQAAVDQAALEKIVAKLGRIFRVPYAAGDVNASSAVVSKLATAIASAEVTGLTKDDITVTVVSSGSTTYPANLTEPLIASDGKVTFYYQDPAASTVNGDATVGKVTFKLSTASGASVTTGECTVNIPWDQAKVKAAMTKAAENLTFDTIKGENTDSANVTKALDLVRSVDGYGWASITWDSSDYDVINVTGGDSLTNFVGTITPAEQNAEVTLTAIFTFNKNNDDEGGDIWIEKEINVTVPGAENSYQSTIDAALTKFTLENLKYATGTGKGQAIDAQAVADNVSLPTPSTLGVDGGRNAFKVAYSVVSPEENSPVSISGYRANVTRPVGETGTQVTLKLTITKQTDGVLNTSYTGSKELTITIAPITLAEINQEIALLDKVKAAYFTGINDGKNVAADAITGNLHAFQEAYADANGNLVWAYAYNDRKDVGIVPGDLPGYDSMGTAGWRAFRSSNTNVITHENLLVTCPATENVQVTVTSYLKSARFSGYYEKYKDDTTYGPLFKRLAGEEVTANLTVISTANQQKAADLVAQISAIGTVTLGSKSAITAARAAYDALDTGTRKLVSNYATLQAAETTLAQLEADLTGYKLSVTQNASTTVGGTAQVSLSVTNKDEDTYNAYHLKVTYDSTKLTYTSINTDATVEDDEAGSLTISGYGDDRTCGADDLVLTFTGEAAGEGKVTVTAANIDKSANAATQDAPAATLVNAEATILVGGYTVVLDKDFDGAGTVGSGENYTFEAVDKHYTYTVDASMGGEPVTAEGNGDGTSFTIKNVTGNLVITTASKTPKSYTVTITGEDTTGESTATYQTDYDFTVTKDDNYTYTVTVKRGEDTIITPTLGEDGKTYTIAGSDITGSITITVTKTAKPTPPSNTTSITFTGEGASDVKNGTTQSATNGSDFTFEIDKVNGYDYTVTLGETTLTAGDDGKYTIPGAQLTGTAITVNVAKVGQVTVEVSAYVTLNEKGTMWLITASGTVGDNKVLAYDGNAMYWSEKYNAYAYLVISAESQETVKADAAGKIAEASATKVSIAYDGDVNGTDVVDINDAQLTYDMYNTRYDSFESVSMSKFLEADLTGDKKLDVSDTAYIVSKINGTATQQTTE